MIAKFLDESVKEDMKETTALDFRYGTRVKDDKKQKVNIYELGKVLLDHVYRRRPRPLESACGATDGVLDRINGGVRGA